MAMRQRWSTVLASPSGFFAVVLVVLLALASTVGHALFHEPATQMDPGNAQQGLSAAHWMGTDRLGRDVLARVVTATRLSVGLAIGATALGTVLGVFLGALPVVLRQRAGRFVVAAINLTVAFPGLLLALFLAVIFGLGAVGGLLAIGLAIAPGMARLTHTLSSAVAGRDYVAAAKILRVGRVRLLTRHILPNIAEPLIVNTTVTTGIALLAFAGLSFLGLGIQPPSFDWGRLLNEGLDRIYVNPAAALAPGVAIVLAGLCFNLMGDVLAQAMGQWGTKRSGAERTPDVTPDPVVASARHDLGEVVLRVKDLSVELPRDGTPLVLVHSVSFEVCAGETVGVVGESGSGKSLTVLAISQLLQYPLESRAEELEFLGHGIRSMRREDLRSLLGRSLAVVFQDPASALNPVLRVGRQLAEVVEVHDNAPRDRALQRAVERLRDVRIPAPEHRARQYPHEFSGGMRQRATIGLALMGSPRLLIADEPTTGLDVTVQAQVLDLLGRARREADAAILFVSHDIAVVTEFCDRVLVMYGGMLVEDISSAQLLEAPAHPYTDALLSTVPEMVTDRSQPLATIRGRPPEPDERPQGCPFVPRCGVASDECWDSIPPLVLHGEGHRVACWNPLTTPEDATSSDLTRPHGTRPA